MCTVSFITNKNGFVLTSNRDEARSRSPEGIYTLAQNDKQLFFPQDKGAGGSWIVASDSNQLVCLLNGAFHKHKRNLPYKMSRGIMMLDFFKYKNAKHFFSDFDFLDIEAFTMVIYDDGVLYECVWDETQLHTKELPLAEKHIWSSATLYDTQMKKERKAWFDEWQIERSDFSAEAILKIHKEGGSHCPTYGYIMNRNNIVETVSITQVVGNGEGMNMTYHDLVRNATKVAKLNFKTQLETLV